MRRAVQTPAPAAPGDFLLWWKRMSYKDLSGSIKTMDFTTLNALLTAMAQACYSEYHSDEE
eukprot:4405640-Prorocentrum_lima.AAC.1